MAKELEIVLEENSGTLYKIQYAGGGQVPDMLHSLFTSRVIAQAYIDDYLMNKKRGATNGKTKG